MTGMDLIDALLKEFFCAVGGVDIWFAASALLPMYLLNDVLD